MTYTKVVPERSLLLFVQLYGNGIEERSLADLVVVRTDIVSVIYTVTIVVAGACISLTITYTVVHCGITQRLQVDIYKCGFVGYMYI